MIEQRRSVTLSVQQLVDCANRDLQADSHGCNGGLSRHAFDYMFNHYLTTEAQYR